MENDHICLTPYVAVRTVNIDKRKVRMKMRVKVIFNGTEKMMAVVVNSGMKAMTRIVTCRLQWLKSH